MHRAYPLLLTITLFLNGQSWAQPQPVGNEWIDYGQTYLKIPVVQPGIYQIMPADLQKAGLTTATIDPTTIQLFHRGVEQAIYVAGESDHHLDPSDFVEFYGRGNDGAPDSLLYRPVSAQPHAYYSLFSDTTAYFLTWRLSGKSGKRMAFYTDTDDTDLTPEPYHWQEEVRVFTETYPGYATGIPPKIEYGHYEAGEGYTGIIQQEDKPCDNLFLLSNAVKTGPGPQIDVLLVGREFTNHRIACLVGASFDTQRGIDTVRFSVYDNARIGQDLAWTDVGPNGRLLISTVSRGDGSGSDRYSVSSVRLRYPQKITADGQSLQTYRLMPNKSGRSLLDVGGVSASTRFWDITDPAAPIRLGATTTAGRARLVVRGTDRARTLLSVSESKPVTAIKPVAFTNWANRRPTYLIVSHEALMQPAVGTSNAVRAYTAYRASRAGGGHDTLTVTMQQLFDQFSYGERHPLAIRRFADHLLRQSNGSPKIPRFLLLLGRSRSTPGVRRNPEQTTLDLVMSYGFPGSDVIFTAGLNGFPADVPALMTGRVNAGTPQEVIDYLDKVREYEASPIDALWRKNLLHLSGGATPAEAGQFRRLVDGYRDQVVGSSLGARVAGLSKVTNNPVERINVVGPVNEGVGLMTFFGHSGLDITDLDIGFCSNDALGYRNKGKYPFLLINGCAIGNFFFGRPTLTADWVLTPDRGAIAALAHSHLGYVDYLDQYSATFYGLLSDSASLNKPIGYLQQETIRRVLARAPDGQALANCQQMVLQGDPAIRLFPFETPDYSITAGQLTVLSADDQALTTLSDSVRIRAVVQNAGQYRRGQLPVRVRRLVNGRESGVFNLTLPRSVAYRDTLTLVVPNERDAEGPNLFEVTVNPTGTIPETNRINNSAGAEVTVAGRGPILIYPPPLGTVKTRSVPLAAESFTTGNRTFDLELDTTSRFDSPALMKQRIRADGSITYPATLVGPARTQFFWRVRAVSDTVWSTASFLFDPAGSETGPPEGQIRLAGNLPADVRQGDVVAIPVQFTNLSPHPFTDSLVVRQTLYAAKLTNPQTTQWRLKSPDVGDTLRFLTRIATELLPGLNRVVLTVNPRLQPEYSFLNNTLNLLVPVQPDALGPVLEVAIDSVRIDDNAVVSARPVIDVLIADDNRSLIRRDTVGLDLYLQRPGLKQPPDWRDGRLNWRNATVQLTGADNVFRVRYPLAELTEGMYRLLVMARDAVGNVAPPYQVRFRVVNERSLTNLTVYPNPFRDQVRFAFRLTGRQAPDAIAITIRDLSGRIVRHRRLPGRIGLNEWTWNGQSDAGEPLPPGLYVYHLTISDTGQEWPIAADVAENGRGRLILTR